MTVGQLLSDATSTLQQAGIETPRLDTLVLLEDICQRDRASLLAHPDLEITQAQALELNTKIEQRATHTPLAYIRGHAPFYGREFAVTPAVLVPRPETEAIIDLLKTTRFALRDALPLHFVDVGSGSGCIGITAALELPGSSVELWDIDPETHAVALQNARTYDVKVTIRQQDLLEREPLIYTDALFANLPYVPTQYRVNQAIRFEPQHAIFSGSDGLDHFRRFWKQTKDLPSGSKPAHIFTESLPEQHDALSNLAQEAGYQLTANQEYAQHFTLSS